MWEIILYFLLFIYWASLWSYISVLIIRSVNKEIWIVWWDSECKNCMHKLSKLDLIPVLSFLLFKWRCRYCWIKLTNHYFKLEVSFWLLTVLLWFISDYLLWISIDKIFFFILFFSLSLFWMYWYFLETYLKEIKK